jgi:hypothetical protein
MEIVGRFWRHLFQYFALTGISSSLGRELAKVLGSKWVD